MSPLRRLPDPCCDMDVAQGEAAADQEIAHLVVYGGGLIEIADGHQDRKADAIFRKVCSFPR